MFSTCNHWFQAPSPPVRTDRTQSLRPIDDRTSHEDRQREREMTLSQRRGDWKVKTTIGDHKDPRADGLDEGLDIEES